MTRKKLETPAPGISLRTRGPVLRHNGGPIRGIGIPARDLSVGDLAYAHRVRALKASGGRAVPKATPADIEAIANDLAATGSFERVSPVAPTPKPAPAGDPVQDAPTSTDEETPE
jgi:hypothetical protein